MVKKALSKRASRKHEAGAGAGADPNSSSANAITPNKREAVVGESCLATQSRHHQPSGNKDECDNNNSEKQNSDDDENGNGAKSLEPVTQ